MKLEDVVLLAKQGFTKEDILRMDPANTDKNETAPVIQETNEPTETENDKPEQVMPEQIKQADNEPDKTAERLDSIEATMNKLLRAVQTSNLHKDSTGGNMPDVDRETDKIMASIIRP